jgi:hypothetical protein
MSLTDGRPLPNPWMELPSRAPYVLSSDRPFVEAFNKHADEAKRLDLSLLPEPFIGNRSAPLVVLGLNPGWSEQNSENYSTPARPHAILANLRDEPEGQVHYALTAEFASAPVGEWWRRSVHWLVLAGQPLEHLARSVLSVEFHGYHSRSFEPIPITLPSQWFGFSLVERAIARGAVIVLMRGRREWQIAVPALASYTRVVRLSNPRPSAISPSNCEDRDWAMILGALGGEPGRCSSFVRRFEVCRRGGCLEPVTDHVIRLCAGHLAEYASEAEAGARATGGPTSPAPSA